MPVRETVMDVKVKHIDSELSAASPWGVKVSDALASATSVVGKVLLPTTLYAQDGGGSQIVGVGTPISVGEGTGWVDHITAFLAMLAGAAAVVIGTAEALILAALAEVALAAFALACYGDTALGDACNGYYSAMANDPGYDDPALNFWCYEYLVKYQIP